MDIRKLFPATAYWPRGVSAAVVGIGARPVAQSLQAPRHR